MEGITYADRRALSTFQALCDKLGKNDNNLHNKMSTLHEELKEVSASSSWGAVSYQLLFSECIDCNRLVPKIGEDFVAPPATALFYATTLLQHNLFMHHDKDIGSLLSLTHTLESDEETTLSQNTTVMPLMLDITKNHSGGSALVLHDEYGKRRASVVSWVLTTLFPDRFPKSRRNGKVVPMGREVALILGGYKNLRGRSFLNNPNKFDEPFPTLPELIKRFFISLDKQGNKMDINGGSSTFKLTVQSAVTWQQPTSTCSSPSDAVDKKPISIWYDKNGDSVTSNLNPIKHEEYVKAIGDGEEFVGFLQEICDKMWLDVWAGVTPAGDCRPPRKGEIQVKLNRIYRPDNIKYDEETGGLLPDVLGDVLLVTNALSPIFHARALAEMNRSEWIPGKHVGKSLKERDYRIVVQDYIRRAGDVFKLSNDDVPLAATEKPNLTEAMGFDVVHKVFSQFDDFVEAHLLAHDSARHYTRWVPERTMCQSVSNWLDGVYGLHDDGSFHHCHSTQAMPADVENGGVTWDETCKTIQACPQFFILPHKVEMRVGTVVIAGDKCAYDNPKPTSKLCHWYKGRDPSKCKADSTVLLGCRDIHFQLWGLQKYTKHKVESLDDQSRLIRRYALSYRMSVGPSDGQVFEELLTRFNITKKRHANYESRPAVIWPLQIQEVIDGDEVNNAMTLFDKYLSKRDETGTLVASQSNKKDIDSSTSLLNDNHSNNLDISESATFPKRKHIQSYHNGLTKDICLSSMFNGAVYRCRSEVWKKFLSCEFMQRFVEEKGQFVRLCSKDGNRNNKRKLAPVDNESEEYLENSDESATVLHFEFGVPPLMSPYEDPCANSTRIEATRLWPGDIVPESEAREQAHISMNDWYSPAWRFGPGKQPSTINRFVVPYPFNNGFIEIGKMTTSFSTKAKQKREVIDRVAYCNHIRESTLPTMLGGAGGSGMSCGTHAEPISNIRSNRPPAKYMMHSDQSHRLPQNVIICDASERRPVVAFFVRWEAPIGSELANDLLVMFLGMFVIDGYSYGRDKNELVESLRHTPGISESDQHNLGFRLFNHFKFNLVPFSSPEHLYTRTTPLKGFNVPDYDGFTYDFTCPVDGGSDNNESLARSFFGTQQYHEFFSNHSQDSDEVQDVTDVNELDNIDNNEYDEIALSKICNAVKLTVTPREASGAMIRGSVANAMRALRHNLDNEGVVHYLVENTNNLTLSDEYLNPLGLVARTAPNHMPSRELDPATAFLLLLSEKTLGTSPDSEDQTVHRFSIDQFENQPILLERFILTSIVIRFLGNIEALSLFIRQHGAHVDAQADNSGNYDYELLDASKVRIFAEYIYESTFMGQGKKGRVGKYFISDQYIASLPEYRWNSDYCRRFLKNAALTTSSAADALMLLAYSASPRFEEAVETIRRCVSEPLLTGRERVSVQFPSLHVMLDLDFITQGRPWGDHTFAVWKFRGYGGDQGLSIIDGSMTCDHYKALCTKKKSKYASHEDYVLSEKCGDPTNPSFSSYEDYVLKVIACDPIGFDEQRQAQCMQTKKRSCSFPKYIRAFEALMKHIKSEYTEEQAKLRGWKKTHFKRHRKVPFGPDWLSQTHVTSLYNGAPLSASYMEQGEGCYMYGCISRAKGTRAINAPSPYRLFAHPTPSKGLLPSRVLKIHQEIVDTWKETCDNGRNRLLGVIGNLAETFRVHDEQFHIDLDLESQGEL